LQRHFSNVVLTVVLQQWHGPLAARVASLNEELSDKPKNYQLFFWPMLS